jgi:hypothetical protein
MGEERIEVLAAKQRAQCVCAICEVATAWFSTSITDLIGSITRNRTTAFTRAGTLSRLITSCGGMVSDTTRRSTRTSRPTPGITRRTPGPYSGRIRPSRKRPNSLSYAP